jgi:hypothetical protein
MRRSAAALAATSVLAVSSLLGPSTVQAAPSDLACPSTGASADACAQLADLEAQLGLLAPVLKLAQPLLAGPALSELGSTSQALTSLLGGTGPVPIDDLTEQAEALQSVLGGLPAPLRDLLGAGPLAELTGALDGLLAELAALTAPVLPLPVPAAGGAAPTPGPAPAATPGAPPEPTRSTSATDATGFGGDLSGPTLDGGTSPGGIPDVPVGSTLHLGSLAAPDFRLDPASVSLPLAEEVAQTSADELVEQVQLAADSAAEAVPGDRSANGLAAVAAMSALLVAAAGAAHLQQHRRVIPD